MGGGRTRGRSRIPGERGCEGLKTRYGLRGKRVATAAALTLAVVAIAVVIGLRRPWAVAVQRTVQVRAVTAMPSTSRRAATDPGGGAFVIAGQVAVSGVAPGHPKEGHGCGLRLKTT